MIALVEAAVIIAAITLILGYYKYQKYDDIFKTLSSLLSLEVLITISIALLSYFSLKFLFNLGSR